jgi:hypothetical protein
LPKLGGVRRRCPNDMGEIGFFGRNEGISRLGADMAKRRS